MVLYAKYDAVPTSMANRASNNLGADIVSACSMPTNQGKQGFNRIKVNQVLVLE